MAGKRITYGDIENLFEAEGFTRKEVDGRLLFQKKDSAAALVLPNKKIAVPAARLHVELVRRTMLDFEIMTEEQVDRWLADPKRFQAA